MGKTVKLTFKAFLNTISISQRDKWVLEKLYIKNTEERSKTDWCKELDAKCKGINYKKI